MLAALYGAIGALPPVLRVRWEGWLQRGGKEGLSKLLAAWGSARLNSAAFEARFLPHTVGARVASAAHDVADAIATGAPDASMKLAALVQAVGLDGWPRFVAAAAEQAAMAGVPTRGEQKQAQLDLLTPRFPLRFDEPPEIALPPRPPLDHYPAETDKPPGPGWIWKGKPGSQPADGNGNWFKPDTGESLRPDPDHPPPIKPHWDYKEPGRSKGRWWRWQPDGRMIPKA